MPFILPELLSFQGSTHLFGVGSFSKIDKSQLFELLVDQLDGCLVTDELGKYIFVNHRWEELTGYSIDDVSGLYVHDVMPDTRVDQVLRTGKAINGQVISIRTKQGDDIHVLCNYIPLFRNDKLMGCFTTISLRGAEELLGLSSQLEDALRQLNDIKKEMMYLQGARYSISNIAGSGIRIQALKASIHVAARSSSTVIIQGETGTGKELVAHSIHTLSPRARQPFIKINCAAIPEELLESELFGYAPGAFTGANKGGKKGKFQLADKGTLFLDEINQLPLHLQPKLLRALQEKEIEPVGGTKTISVDCRIIAASNISLEKLVREGKFRSDLFYRLNIILLDVPALRDRKEDIPKIATALIGKLNEQLRMAVPGISQDCLEHLQEYDWPGNVRELQNVIERAMNIAWMDTLTWKHFEGYLKKKRSSINIPSSGDLLLIRNAKEQAERDIIIQALNRSNGNKTAAAKVLGITRAMLYRKLQKYGIENMIET